MTESGGGRRAALASVQARPMRGFCQIGPHIPIGLRVAKLISRSSCAIPLEQRHRRINRWIRLDGFL